MDLGNTRKIGRSTASNQELLALVETGPQFSSIYDFAGRCFFLNEAWMLYTGTSRESQLGMGWTVCVHPDDRPVLLESWRDALAVGTPLSIELRIRGRSGEYRWFKQEIVRSKHQLDGKGDRWFGSSTDVTFLKDRLLAFEDQDRRKNEFLAMAAHELRNSLMPLIHAVGELEQTQGTSGLPDICARLRRSVGHQTSLIEGLVDVAKVSVGQIELDRSAIDCHECLQQAIELAQPLLEQKHQQIVKKVPASPIVLTGDFRKLVQALSNVLLNAAKYSPPGAMVTIEVTASSRHVQIAVHDTGPGLTDDAIARIFKLFERETSTRASGGLGVGLALARRFVEAHAGTVTARSAGPGLGSTFTIDLPRDPAIDFSVGGPALAGSAAQVSR